MNENQITGQEETPPVGRALVVGVGTMGRGIAQVTAEAGIETSLYDVDAAGLERGVAAIEKQWRNAVVKGRRSEADIERFRAHL
ncbi:MAG TPA: 3-hydroxyacyl-CoA dehydrogenase NAD-binding domain-containing protein, partial [Thermomicrobiales bacterium]|nr:3-hydroxyacyl-CoA dehydrogenase NAD-binding domain-containing protein [Thermomicrobiales bacterium]